MGLKIEDKEKLKKEIKELLSKLIEVPNKDVFSVQAHYDPSLNVITLAYVSLVEDKRIIVFDEEV